MLDFSEWASVYRTYLARQAEYRNEVQRRRQQQVPSLAGLVRVAVSTCYLRLKPGGAHFFIPGESFHNVLKIDKLI